jgi:hypothetical protein
LRRRRGSGRFGRGLRRGGGGAGGDHGGGPSATDGVKAGGEGTAVAAVVAAVSGISGGRLRMGGGRFGGGKASARPTVGRGNVTTVGEVLRRS